jgi:hypothetical protein
MRKKFPILLVPLMCLLTLGSYVANASENQVLLTLSGGKSVTFSFSEAPKVTYAGSTVTVTTSDDAVEYAISDIKKLSFGSSETVGVEDAPAAVKAGDIAYANGVFQFSGFGAGERVYLYTIGGVLRGSYAIPGSGALEVSTSSLPAGIYVVTINGITYKFNKR